MKKLIMLSTILLVSFVSIQSIEKLNIRNDQNIYNTNVQFQFQIVIYNKTTNVIPGKFHFGQETYFYLDISLRGEPDLMNSHFSNILDTGPFNDTFITQYNAYETIYSQNITNIPVFYINFTFGTLYWVGLWYHAQLTSTNSFPNGNCYIDFHKKYNETGDNGTRLVISAYGSDNANTANWEFQYYKF